MVGMKNLRHVLVRLVRLTPRLLVRKALRRLGSIVLKRRARRTDSRTPTSVVTLGAGDNVELTVIWGSPAPAADDSVLLNRLAAHYVDHRFDILGSGWTIVRHGMSCRGVEGHRHPSGPAVVSDLGGHWLEGRINQANLAHSKEIWALVDADYIPIDWHLDFKSGYRWREDCWYRDIKVAPGLGVDIKVPWELARMQHLPQLARAYVLVAPTPDADRLAREFRNEVLDFIATNPPRYGVNWACTMDVGIRVANWLIAYDLFRAAGAVFDHPFRSVFAGCVRDHAIHIAENLEWQDGLRGNHYLANIVGLLFAAAYLPDSTKVNIWLGFAVQQLLAEVDHQFHEEGSNFEASTVYHRLSAELVVYATALIAALPTDRVSGMRPGMTIPAGELGLSNASLFPESYWAKLERMAEFTIDVTGPDGNVIQIGDNDSGRLFKLYPTYHELPVSMARDRFLNLEGYDQLPDNAGYLLERVRDHRHLVAAINGFFDRKDFADFAGDQRAESEFVRRSVVAPLLGLSELGRTKSRTAIVPGKIPIPPVYRSLQPRYTFPGLCDGLVSACYQSFGIYIYRSPLLFLAIRCGENGLNGIGAHAHNDQLSIELWINGQPIMVDPGTYLYTALPGRRNAYRSVEAHSGPRLAGREPGNLEIDLFALGNEAQARCLVFDRSQFLGCYSTGQGRIYRAVAICDDSIQITDWSEKAESDLVSSFGPVVPFSGAYGWIERPEADLQLAPTPYCLSRPISSLRI